MKLLFTGFSHRYVAWPDIDSNSLCQIFSRNWNKVFKQNLG